MGTTTKATAPRSRARKLRLKPPATLAPPPPHTVALLASYAMLKSAAGHLRTVALTETDPGNKRVVSQWADDMHAQADRVRALARPSRESWTDKPARVALGSDVFEAVLSLLAEVTWSCGVASHDNRLAMLSAHLNHAYDLARRAKLTGSTMSISTDARSLIVTLPRTSEGTH